MKILVKQSSIYVWPGHRPGPPKLDYSCSDWQIHCSLRLFGPERSAAQSWHSHPELKASKPWGPFLADCRHPTREPFDQNLAIQAHRCDGNFFALTSHMCRLHPLVMQNSIHSPMRTRVPTCSCAVFFSAYSFAVGSAWLGFGLACCESCICYCVPSQHATGRAHPKL